MDRQIEPKLSAVSSRADRSQGRWTPRLAHRLLMLCAAACLIPSTPAAAQMIFNVSSYNDLWPSDDLTSVFGASSFIDDSSGCGHSGYNTTAMMITPDERQFLASGSLSGYPSGPTNGVEGVYTEVGTMQFHCSCVGTVGAGGDQQCLARSKHKPAAPPSGGPLASEGATRESGGSIIAKSRPEGAGLERSRANRIVIQTSAVLTLSSLRPNRSDVGGASAK